MQSPRLVMLIIETYIFGLKRNSDAVDPASPDYGAPFTLAQAQQHLTASAIGSRITWHRAVPEEFLKASKQKWDVVILLHCIWYFPSSKTLSSILAALHDKVGRVCIAEYALHATEKTAVPHVLAALARGTLESLKGESGENIRSPMSQRAITQIAEEASWRVASQSKIVPEAGLLDGTWEVGSVASDGFIEEVKTHVADERLSLVLQSARDATKAAVADLGAAKVQTMDVWVADFAPAV